jgi:integrase
MKRERLTPERIRRFTCPPDAKQAFFWDTLSPRLAVRATAATKSFIFEAKLNRQTIRTTIGDVRAWNLDDARQEANRLQTLTDQGIDPREQKRERIAAAESQKDEARRQDATVAEAWSAYLEARKAKWSERHLSNHQALAKPGGEPRTRGRRPGEPATTMPGPIYPLLALKLSALDADTVSAWLETETKRGPGQTAQAYRALRAFVGWCAEHKEYGPATHADACTSKAVKELAPVIGTKDGDSLQREQLRAWFEAVRRIRNPVITAYLQALLLTGARRDELAGLTWDGLDFAWNSMKIHDKVEGERVIPLTPYVAALLAGLPRRKDQDDKPLPWVFSSPTAASGRLQEPRIQHVAALTAAGLPHVSLHGLRRSFGSLAEWTETPVGIVAQIMGHKPSALAEKHYRRRPLDLLRMWHVKIEAWILEQAGIEQPKEIGLRLVKTA